jgi:hypothetical protein
MGERRCDIRWRWLQAEALNDSVPPLPPLAAKSLLQ